MKPAPRELLPSQLEAALQPIFRHAVTEIRENRMVLNWDHFISEWTKWTTIGIARTWALEGAAVGGVFSNDLFSGTPRALAMFWLSTPAGRRVGQPIRVLRAFEHAARSKHAKPAAAMHLAVSPAHLSKVYRRLGYSVSEIIFSK